MTWDLRALGEIVAGLAGVLSTWWLATRAARGRVNVTDADALWRESATLRDSLVRERDAWHKAYDDLNTRHAAGLEEVMKLRAEMAEQRREAAEARRDHRQCRKDVEALLARVAGLEKQVTP